MEKLIIGLISVVIASCIIAGIDFYAKGEARNKETFKKSFINYFFKIAVIALLFKLLDTL